MVTCTNRYAIHFVHKHTTITSQVRRIDAAKDIAETLASSRGNVTYLPAGQGSNMLLGLGTGGQ
jgi:hypothetical protein